MCVVEKSGAREYKVLLLLLFSFSSPSFPCERFVLPSSHCVLRLLVFLSLSLCRHSIGWLSLSRRRRLEMEGRRSNESRGVVFAPRRVSSSSSISVVPKVGREETRAALGNDWIDARKSVVDTTAPQNRAQFNRAARDARERVGTISARLSRGKWICPRESTATFEMRGRGWVVDDEASTKRHDQSRRSLFFSLFFIFLEKNFETFGCETFLIRPMKICVHIFVCVLS